MDYAQKFIASFSLIFLTASPLNMTNLPLFTIPLESHTCLSFREFVRCRETSVSACALGVLRRILET